MLTKANVAKRLKASKKHVAFYKKRGWKSQVIIHEDEKWFIRGAPQAIWAGKDEPPVFKHSPRVAKLQREKIMVHATVSNVPGAAKISLVFCEKDKVAQKNSKHHKRHDVYKVDRRVDGVFYREILSETVPGRGGEDRGPFHPRVQGAGLAFQGQCAASRGQTDH